MKAEKKRAPSPRSEESSSPLLSIEPGEHYHVKTSVDQFDAQLVGQDGSWLYFKRAKLLSGVILSHNTTIPVQETMPDDFAVGIAQIVRLEPWQP